MPRVIVGISGGIVAVGLILASSQTFAQEPESRPLPAPPPRTVGDITDILDQQTPDTARNEKLREGANAVSEKKMSKQELADFLHRRGIAASQLGRTE